ncbi:MAG: enoyl-CoA hydratase/isomerase family protein [Thermonemataceae bacterium]
MKLEFIQYTLQERTAYITLNRPEKRNALNHQVVTELKTAFKNAEEDKQVKVIVLNAKGKAFCAGADLAYIQHLQENTFEENLADSSHLKELFYQIYTHPKVVIAAVQGHAIAGGCGLATVCDVVFAVPEARFGYTEVRIGFIPAIVSLFLIRKIGEAKAKELLLSGELITAAQAAKDHLINFIVEAATLSEEVDRYAKILCEKNSAEAMAATKLLMAHIQEMDLVEALEYAAKQNARTRESDDCRRGIAAFLNQEKIIW